MTQEEMKVQIQKCIEKVTTEFAENYKAGRKLAAYATVDYDAAGGRLLLVMWPNTLEIDLCWSPNEAGLGDLGTMIGSVSLEYFGIDTITDLIAAMIYCFMDA